MKQRLLMHRLFRLVPALDSLRRYTPHLFYRDLMAGLTVAAVAIPQAMAYAAIAGLPVKYGLYTAIVMTAVGALFDSSKHLINGPTNAISIALLSALGPFAESDKVAMAVLLALFIGLIQTGITLFKLGDLSRYISHSVIVGFTAGAAVLLVLDQLKNLFGFRGIGGHEDHFIRRFYLTMTDGGPVHGWTMMLGFGTIVLVLCLRWLGKRIRIQIPEFMIAIIITAAIVWGFDLAKVSIGSVTFKNGVAVVGEVPRALPSFTIPSGDWNQVRELSGSALAIAILGLLEAIAMAKAIASNTGQKLDINQQCLSEGLANLTGSFFQCFPGSGSLTRSAINHHAGAATQWSGVFSAIAVAVFVLLFAPLARYIPRAALAGILIVSAWRMLDYEKLKYYIRTTRFDAGIVLATAFSAVAISVEFCVMIGTFLSFIFYVPRAAMMHLTELTITSDRMIRDRMRGDPPCNRMLIYDMEGELFFGSAQNLEKSLLRIEHRAAEGIRIVVLRLKRVRNPDAVCLSLLEDFLKRMENNGVIVLLCGVRQDMYRVLDNIGLVKRLGPNRIYTESDAVWSSTLAAVRDAHNMLGDDLCSHCPVAKRKASDAEKWHYII
ncbi:MAG: SulP family inorganic anion transporter [Nitrospirae bacterium]|nr:SulP family inorganic anion transporter [Nitrospirota bacterium]